VADARIAARTGERSGIAHFVEHMLFKGTGTRSAEDIAQAIDSIGGQLDGLRPARIRQLLHQGP
jgi:predicted Zn-dependent peptidase